ncbi:cuticle collagen 40-like [Nyctibius grandis]|uniref:cuticle collagen 40-like n=1 Tax=Nyctibius grandis TaxID=48427 RepID=UPI0035BBDC5C
MGGRGGARGRPETPAGLRERRRAGGAAAAAADGGRGGAGGGGRKGRDAEAAPTAPLPPVRVNGAQRPRAGAGGPTYRPSSGEAVPPRELLFSPPSGQAVACDSSFPSGPCHCPAGPGDRRGRAPRRDPAPGPPLGPGEAEPGVPVVGPVPWPGARETPRSGGAPTEPRPGRRSSVLRARQGRW